MRPGPDIVFCIAHIRNHQEQARMVEQTNPLFRGIIIEALNTAVRDVAEDKICDAESVQAEARRMRADHERAQPAKPGVSPVKRTRAA
jgi:hypothetical protein